MKILIKFIYIIVCSVCVLGSSITYAQQQGKQLYKWQDENGKWHYSNIRPTQPDNKAKAPDVSVANDARTIMFTQEQGATKTGIVESSPADKLMKRQSECSQNQANMRSLSKRIQKDIDRSLVEQNITQEQYLEKKKTVAGLENFSIDDAYYQSCIKEFVDLPKGLPLYACIMSIEDDYACAFSTVNDAIPVKAE